MSVTTINILTDGRFSEFSTYSACIANTATHDLHVWSHGVCLLHLVTIATLSAHSGHVAQAGFMAPTIDIARIRPSAAVNDRIGNICVNIIEYFL